jgi:hypothetical protein
MRPAPIEGQRRRRSPARQISRSCSRTERAAARERGSRSSQSIPPSTWVSRTAPRPTRSPPGRLSRTSSSSGRKFVHAGPFGRDVTQDDQVAAIAAGFTGDAAAVARRNVNGKFWLQLSRRPCSSMISCPPTSAAMLVPSTTPTPVPQIINVRPSGSASGQPSRCETTALVARNPEKNSERRSQALQRASCSLKRFGRRAWTRRASVESTAP